MERVSALWEALEFYAAQVPSLQLFSKAERRNLRTRAQQSLTSEQSARLDQVFEQLNSSSLLERIWAQADADLMPCSDGDKNLLRRMQTLRNDAVHGRAIQLPTREDLSYAVSIVARLLIFRATGSAKDEN